MKTETDPTENHDRAPVWPRKRKTLFNFDEEMRSPVGKRLAQLCGLVDRRVQWRAEWEKARSAMLRSD